MDGRLIGNQFIPQQRRLILAGHDLALNSLIPNPQDKYLTLTFIDGNNQASDMRMMTALLDGPNPFLKILQYDLAKRHFDLAKFHPAAKLGDKMHEYVADVVAAQALQAKIKSIPPQDPQALKVITESVYYLHASQIADAITHQPENPQDPHVLPRERIYFYLQRLLEDNVISVETFIKARKLLVPCPSNLTK